MESKEVLSIKNEIEELQQKQYSLLETAIKKEVQNIFKTQKRLVKFTDVMGTSFFTDKKGNNVDLMESYLNKRYDYETRVSFPYFETLVELYRLIPNFCIGETIQRT